MLVKTREGLVADGKQLSYFDEQLVSVDYLLTEDGLGFAFSDVACRAGFGQDLWYKHHWEANYIIDGTCSVEDLSSGERWVLQPGDLFGVGPQDRHRFVADTDVHAVSVFNPPLGADVEYDDDGSLAPSGELPPRQGRLFVKRGEDMRARERVVAGGSARSTRMLLQKDQLGVTLCDVRLAAGASNELWYKHHWEANYILQGSGLVADLTTGESWPLVPGMMYIVGPEDRHSMRADTDLHLLSVFNPPLRGDEMHDEQGTLPASGPLPPGPQRASG